MPTFHSVLLLRALVFLHLETTRTYPIHAVSFLSNFYLGEIQLAAAMAQPSDELVNGRTPACSLQPPCTSARRAGVSRTDEEQRLESWWFCPDHVRRGCAAPAADLGSDSWGLYTCSTYLSGETRAVCSNPRGIPTVLTPSKRVLVPLRISLTRYFEGTAH